MNQQYFISYWKKSSLLAWCMFAALSGIYLQGQEMDTYYQKKTSRETTLQASREAVTQALGFIQQSPWKMLGPFDNPEGRTMPVELSPEKELNLSGEYEGANGQKMKWKEIPQFVDGQTNNLNLFPQNDYILVYMHRTIRSEREAPGILYLAADDAIKVWLNGQLIHEQLKKNSTPLPPAEVRIELQEGDNTLLMKVGNVAESFHCYYRLWTASMETWDKVMGKIDIDFPQGEPRYYRLETISVPPEIALEVGGMTFAPNGSLLICIRRGDIWSFQNNAWRLFASGLDEPLGIINGDKPGEFIVAQKPELTRITDIDGDGRADLFETITDAWEYSGQMYEWSFCPVRDKEGNIWVTTSAWFFPKYRYNRPPYAGWEIPPPGGTTPNPKTAWRGWIVKITPKGEFIPWACGFRSPNGIVISPDDEIFVAENQGEYFASNPFFHIKKGAFYGFPTGLFWDSNVTDPFAIPLEDLDLRRTLPALQLPYGPMGQSISQPVWDLTGGKFGPFSNQIIIGDQIKCMLIRCALEKVQGEYQGVAIPFRYGYQCGINRLAFAPDGSLYAGQTDRGWGSIGNRPYGLQRLSWTGEVPFEILNMKITRSGFDLQFTLPVDISTATNLSNYAFEYYYYPYHRVYGGPQRGNTPVAVKQVSISADKKTVSLTLPNLVEKRIYELQISKLLSESGLELLHPSAYYTLLNRIK